MTNRTKFIISLLCAFVIVGIAFRYFTTVENQVFGGIPPHSENAQAPRSHLRGNEVKQATPTSAFLNAFESPITLYGKVVDQFGDPVVSATVKLSPISKPFSDSASAGLTLVSDSDGKFSIKGLRGFSMGVSVRKDEDYLHLSPLGGPASSAMVSYDGETADGRRYSDPTTPLTLTLHKIGTMEPLVHMGDTRWKLPINGHVRRVTLNPKNILGLHQIEFRYSTDWIKVPADDEHFRSQFDWSLEMRILGGGFVWSDDEYNFEAPEKGYQEKVRLDYTAAMPRELWKRTGQGSFFVKFTDGCYGRIRVQIDGMERGSGSPLTLTSWLNLKPGSRNLATPDMTPSADSAERFKREWK